MSRRNNYCRIDNPQIKQEINAFYDYALAPNQSYWSQAALNNRFEAGDQSVWQEWYGEMGNPQNRTLSFNRIRRIINMISGYQRNHRKSLIALPQHDINQMGADQYSKILLWAMNRDNMLDTISSAFHGSLISGMNLLHLWTDYRNDPVNGDIRLDNCGYNSFFIDPYFRKPDLSDCNAILKRSYVSKMQAVSLMPQYADEIAALPSTPAVAGSDGKFNMMPEQWGFQNSNLVAYDEYYYASMRKATFLVDTMTGETKEWTSNDKEKLSLFLYQFPDVKVIEQPVSTVNLAIQIQDQVFYDGPNPSGDTYPFVPIFAYYNPDLPYLQDRLQSVVTGLRDPQFLFNRRQSINLDIFESQINSGFIVKSDSVVNPQDLFKTGQGKVIFTKGDPSSIIPITAPNLPPAMLEMAQQLANEIQQISGVNEELLGTATDDKAAVLSKLRQGAGLVTLQPLYDQLDNAVKILGGKLVNMIQNNFTPGKVQQILGEQPVEEFYNRSFEKYDIIVEEGLNTATQKQMQFAQLLQLREMGVPIPDESLLDAATIQNKNKILEIMAQEKQQAQQAQQAQSQAQQEVAQAQVEQARGSAAAHFGLAQERLSRIEENKQLAVERAAEAEKDEEQGLLNFVRAIKELQQIDLANVEKLLTVSALHQNMRSQMASPLEQNVAERQQQPANMEPNMNSGMEQLANQGQPMGQGMQQQMNMPQGQSY